MPILLPQQTDYENIYLIEFFSVPIVQIPQIGKIAKNAEFFFIDGNLAFFAILPILRYLHFWDFCVLLWDRKDY